MNVDILFEKLLDEITLELCFEVSLYATHIFDIYAYTIELITFDSNIILIEY
jgi:hypothetical protein